MSSAPASVPDPLAAPRLLFFFNGLPEYEALFEIAVRLQARGRVQPVCLSTSEVLRREARLRDVIARSGLAVTARPSRWIKLRPKRWLRDGDAAMTLVDPTMDESPTRPRSQAMLAVGMPTIFLQHGVMQGKLNLATDRLGIDYSAALLLLFEAPILPEVLSEQTQKKVAPVGFIKKPLFPPRPPKGALPPHRRALLFCHSFRWTGRYGEADVARFYALVDDYAADHPDDLIIVRSHRGKSRKLYATQERELERRANVVLSHAYRGPLRGMSMTDVLGLADLCVTTTSTAVLDSVYMDVPTAIYENDQPVFQVLPQVFDRDSMEMFAAKPDRHALQAVRAHYGAITANIEASCEAIERALVAT